MIIDNVKIGKLRIILQAENTTQTILYNNIATECAKRGLKPITKSDISLMCFGDKPDRRISTYLKFLLGLNAIRRRSDPYVLEDIIEPDLIFESAKKD